VSRKPRFEPRELALGGLFGAAGLALPFLFHLVQLGSVFLPMYLPLLALAFFVRPGVAAATGLAVPLLSALLTGMPPWFPPVAPAMALELSAMAALASWAFGRWPHSVLAVLVPALVLGRVFQFGFGWLLGLFLDLPPEFLSVASMVRAFPGVILMLVVIPSVVRVAGRRAVTTQEL